MVHPSPRFKIVIISVLVILGILWAGLYFYWANYYQNRIYPGVSIGELALGGTSGEQAETILRARVDNILNSGITFKTEQKSVIMPLSSLSLESELSFPVLAFEKEKMINSVLGDKKPGFFGYIWFWFKSDAQKNIKPSYQLNKDLIRLWLDENFSELSSQPKNAYFSLGSDKKTLIKNPETTGLAIDYQKTLSLLTSALDKLQSPIIDIEIIKIEPKISLKDLDSWENDVKKVISDGEIRLSVPNNSATKNLVKKNWVISNKQLVTWLTAETSTNPATLILDQPKVLSFLTETIAPLVDQEAILPRFEIKDGRVISWRAGQAGYRLNATSSSLRIIKDFASGQKNSILEIDEINANNLSTDYDFQIKEVIGTGHSRFSGSPANRRHNIKIGADALHGLLIKPDEEFSLLKALGEIDASSGYLPELVIKGDKTVPEYGGGLCQIGTTVFRSALNTGLPITQRRNHSYRVSYYEPAGTDATIYDPAPDFRFLNDTGNYILIQSRIEGDDLYFDFWGTKDGRIASTTDPVIYNIVKPAPTKMIETETLAPGEKKCTESAHSGADAYFDYTVTYPEGSTTTPVQTRRFSSHYIPWQAVCLIGKATSTAPIETTATSTLTETEEPLNNN